MSLEHICSVEHGRAFKADHLGFLGCQNFSSVVSPDSPPCPLSTGAARVHRRCMVNRRQTILDVLCSLSPTAANYALVPDVCSLLILVPEVLILFLFLISLIESLIVFNSALELKLIINVGFYFSPYSFDLFIYFWFL